MQIDLSPLPPDAIARDVEANAVLLDGEPCLRLTLSDRARNGTYGVDYVDQPTFLLLPVDFTDGRIEVNLLARLLPDAPDYSRGFIGLAYRIDLITDQFECVYLRPTNGRKLAPPAPRDNRAIQYFTYPDWKFDRLREEEPDGPYEAGANIGPDEWIALAIEVNGFGLRAFVNGQKALDVPQTKATPHSGQIGLWVDIGTEGYFSGLNIFKA
jgi:hypothetical protein